MTRLTKVLVFLVLTAVFSLHAVQGQVSGAKEIIVDYPDGAEITEFLKLMKRKLGPVISILPSPDVTGKIKPIYLKATPEVVLDKVLTANGFSYDWIKKDNVIIVYKAKPQAKVISPSDEKAMKKQGRLAGTYEKEGHYEKAIAIYQEMIAKYPKCEWTAQAQVSLGNCYRKQKKYKQAIEEYKKAIREFPETEWAPPMPKGKSESAIRTKKITPEQEGNFKKCLQPIRTVDTFPELNIL